MANVISMAERRRAQQAQRSQTELDLSDHWAAFVKQSWRPVQGVKRGAVRAVMAVAYRASDQGKVWLQVCPLDLIQAALPAQWTGENLERAAYLTTLFWDYLAATQHISEQDKDFAFAWTRDAELTMHRLLARFGTLPDHDDDRD